MKTEQGPQPDWMQELASPPFNEPMFTAKMKSDVSQSAANGLSRKRRGAPARLISMTAGVLALLLIAAIWGWRESPALQRMIPIQGWGYAAKWTPRSVYTVDGVDKLQVFPAGNCRGLSGRILVEFINPDPRARRENDPHIRRSPGYGNYRRGACRDQDYLRYGLQRLDASFFPFRSAAFRFVAFRRDGGSGEIRRYRYRCAG